MIIEDSGEQERSANGRTFIGDALTYRKVPYKRDEIRINGIRCGDYTNEDMDFLVERKRADDFVGSVLDGRLFEQIARMHDSFEGYKEIIFVGDWEETIDKVRREHNTSLAAFVETAQLRLQLMGVQWWIATDETEAAKRIIFLDRYAKGNKQFELKHHKQKHYGIEDERLKTILNMPNIGSKKTAQMILEKFGTVMDFVKMCQDDKKQAVETLKGTRIGIATVEKVAKIFSSDKEVNFHETGISTNSDSSEGSEVLPKRSKKASSDSHVYRRGQNH